MSDRPIMFSAAMTLALLSGEKKQTRRLAWRECKPGKVGVRNTGRAADDGSGIWENPSSWQQAKAGDRLWVREAWGINDYRYIDTIPKQRPDDLEQDHIVYFATENDAEILNEMRRRSSIHMPRWASRLTLTVTDVRVQRLQEITSRDCYAEGIHPIGPEHHPEIPRNEFRDLWNGLHGPLAWEANPEVVALTFTVERRNIDAVAA